MSTGNLSLDLLLNDIYSGENIGKAALRSRFSSLNANEIDDIYKLICGTAKDAETEKASLVVTAPLSFAVKAKTTKATVEEMIVNAKHSILLTGYSLSEYFNSLVDQIILKSQRGVFVKIFANDIDEKTGFDKLKRYKGRFLEIYDYTNDTDHMAALHAKVISVDGCRTLITSANLSYHGQEGNIEVGTEVYSKQFAKQLNNFFTSLIFAKVFTKI